MAPGRKRGAKSAKAKELSIGDLVLAKVKGFPAWPAKISKPEDWHRTPDPKKYFVQFFGTSEIAFVAPADIQAFTSEAKNKLSARCLGKTVKYFAQAVKEICEEFEELQRKNCNGENNDACTQILASETNSMDPVIDEAVDISGSDGTDRDGPQRESEIKEPTVSVSGLEGCSQRKGDTMECEDTKPYLSDDVNHSLSPHISPVKKKVSTNCTNIVKESISAVSPSYHSPCNKGGSRDIREKNRYSDVDQTKLKNDQPKLVKKNSEGTGCRNGGSHEHTGEILQRRTGSGSNMKVSSADNSRSALDVNNERKEKQFLKEKKHPDAVNDDQVDAEAESEEHTDVLSRKKLKVHHGREKQSYQTTKVSSPVKPLRCADTNDTGSLRSQISGNHKSGNSDVLDDTTAKIQPKKLTLGGKAENDRTFRVQTITHEHSQSTDEDDLPPTKRHRGALEAMSSSALSSETKMGSSASRKNESVRPNKLRSPTQFPKKRRAIVLCEDEDDELPKTPIHGGFTNKVSAVQHVSGSKRKPVMHGESQFINKLVSRNSGTVNDSLKEQLHSAQASKKAFLPAGQQGVEKSTGKLSPLYVSPRPSQFTSEKLPATEVKQILLSPKRSPRSVTGGGPVTESENKQSSKTPVKIPQKKAPAGANRGLGASTERSTLIFSQLLDEKSKPATSGEKLKSTPKSGSQINNSVGNPTEKTASFGERLDVGNHTKTSYPKDSKIPDTVMSMKNLIAAAQARKKEAHIQNAYGSALSLLIPDAEIPGQSPSSGPESSKTLQLNVQRVHHASHSSDGHQFSSVNQLENEELEERRVSSDHWTTDSSLSGGTEAAVARDAFEGMIETLSRTKDSIGRATRLAIDCAKYGIANEVVDLLVKKLEKEPSLHRRVDLFFLVDSITQVSHQKGIASASYVPIVQTALPRIIGAAAPSGTGSEENRRQCHKVLRLWLERKILPESVLRRYMDNMKAPNDGIFAGLSLRRPSRAERAIDDPIREMEDMFVDEYGSNANFQLPGLLSSHIFEEEEDEDNFPTNLANEVADASPSKHTPGASTDPESHTVTPGDRRHCILQDVDVELEMEDVSGHLKDEKPSFISGISLSNVNGIHEAGSEIHAELLSSPEGSPPPSPGPPPETPPLPTSPPPSPSPSPPPPPPATFPTPPPPPPPSPPSSQQNLYPPPFGPPSFAAPPSFAGPHAVPPPLPPGPPPHLLSQQQPLQPSFMSQHMQPPLPPTIATSPPSTYQPPPLQHQIGAIPTANQHLLMVPNSQGSHTDASLRSEVLSQPSSCFPSAAVSNSQEKIGYNTARSAEYGQPDAYMTPQASQHRQPFLPGGGPFAQRPLHPEPPLQLPPSQFSYPNSMQQYQYPSHPLPNFPDGSRRNVADERWRMQVNEFNADCPRGGWMTGGRSGLGPPYSQQGYFGPPTERPPPSAVTFQPPVPNTLPAVPPMAVHGGPMMPCRPDLSNVNWRPA